MMRTSLYYDMYVHTHSHRDLHRDAVRHLALLSSETKTRTNNEQIHRLILVLSRRITIIKSIFKTEISVNKNTDRD